MGNYTLNEPQNPLKGTNSNVFITKYKGIPVVRKQYSISSRKLGLAIHKLLIDMRRLVNSTPEILYENITDNSLTYVEIYTGKSLGQLKLEGLLSEEIYDRARNFILELPTSIPLDTNPYNFTIDSAGKLYFVDFMPPDPWAFLDDYPLRSEYELCFPSVVSALTRPLRKQRYHDPEMRVRKFDYYLHQDYLVPFDTNPKTAIITL